MNNGKTIGMILFFGGILLLIGYGIIQGFNEIMESLTLISGFLIGITIIGFFTLLIAIIMEQKHNTKETMKKIKKEDLKP